MGSTFGCLEEKKEGQEGEDEDTFPYSPDNDQSKDDQLREEQKDDDEKEKKRGAAYWEGDGKGEILVSLGMITPHELYEFLELQLREKILESFL